MIKKKSEEEPERIAVMAKKASREIERDGPPAESSDEEDLTLGEIMDGKMPNEKSVPVPAPVDTSNLNLAPLASGV
jgi:hypothetical protein